MDLRKGKNFTSFYFVFVFIFTFACCFHATTAACSDWMYNNVIDKKICSFIERRLARRQESSSSKDPTKSLIVQEIMKKVSNLTLSALSQAPHQTVAQILKKIKTKLESSAKIIGPHAKKYIDLIMEEFKQKMKNSVRTRETENLQGDKEVKEKNVIRRNKDERKVHATIDIDTKKEIIKDIATKIQTLAKAFMKNAKTIESKQEILEKIKKRIMESTNQKHVQLHNKHTELKAYSSLIAQGLEESMRKILESESVGRRMDNQAQENINETLEEIIPNEPVEDSVSQNFTKEDILKKTMVIMDLEEINKYRVLMSESLKDTSVDPRCGEIVEDICLDIKLINQLPCDKGKVIPIESLCNNVSDCINGTDEKNCAAQAMEQVHKATKVMSEIEASINRKCFAATGNGLLISQNEILRDVLQTQINFLNQHNNTQNQGTGNKLQVADDKFVKRTVTDVNKILSTLSYALDGSLCARITAEHQGNTDLRKFNDIEVDAIDELDENVSREPGWTLKSCRCQGPYCEDPTCPGSCKRVCWQRYSLDHWGCQALNGDNAVTLNDICDGKLDCFDETDENFCVTDGSSKFGATKSYSNLLDLLATKSKSNDFIKYRSKFVALQSLVRQLQKETIRTSTDIHTIKSLRDDAFKMLVTIYDNLLDTTNLDELEDQYLILLAIHEKLVTALKGSHAGNDNLISSEGCFCRDGQCALRRCNKHCIQSCLAEPWLTKFSCNDDKNHTTPIESICNGIKNCPNEEDEKDCVKDVCRAHHLVVLRHNLEKVGAKHKSTIMGETIDLWKTKVTASLIIAETAERTTRRVMVEMVRRVLQDLVSAFAAMEDYRRANSLYALQEFQRISKIVMQTLKSCLY